jgi:hypothetical protein
LSDLRELLSVAAPDPDELDLDRVHRRGRTRRNRTRLAVGALGVLALIVVGTVALLSESSDNGRVATDPPSTTVPPTTTSAIPTTTTTPTVTSVAIDDAHILAFIAAVDDTLARQPWENRCTSTADGFSVGIPAGWFEPTPDPPDPAAWPASGYLSLDFLACKFFGPTPFTICICEPNFATVQVGSQGGDSGPYADAVDGMLRLGTDDHVVTEVSGHEAQCFSRSFGPGEVGARYAADCYIERDGGVLFMGVSVGAPNRQELAEDGTVIRSTSLPVPEEARDAARRLRDAIVQTIQLIE